MGKRSSGIAKPGKRNNIQENDVFFHPIIANYMMDVIMGTGDFNADQLDLFDLENVKKDFKTNPKQPKEDKEGIEKPILE